MNSQYRYAYRAVVQAMSCGIKRAVVHNDYYDLDWWQAGKELHKQITSQTCVRCGRNHSPDDFVVTEIEQAVFGTPFYIPLKPVERIKSDVLDFGVDNSRV